MTEKEIDQSRLTMENLDNLTEEEILAFEQKYKDENFPQSKIYGLVAYNVVVCGLSMYYTINFKKFSQKLFKPKKFGLMEIFKYGSIQSLVFVSTYILGTCIVTGMWNPVQYLRELAKIKGKIIDNTVRHDQQLQKYVLFDVMNYFGLSNDLLNKAQTELIQQKKELDEKNFFQQKTKDILENKKDD